MRLSISNIAWDVPEDEAVATLLCRHGVNAIDIAPTKYFANLAEVTDAEIARVKAWWAQRGIEVTGMQSLLFGTTGLNIFGPAEVQDAMLRHLDAICRIGAGLAAPRLVFGSPRNRDRSGLDDAQALQIAVPFFQRLGGIAQKHGVLICLEPNPSRYGANFMTSSRETAQVVAQVGHPAIRMQFDTGALAINGEDPAAVLNDAAHLIGHIHASDPDLVPVGDGGTDHGDMARALAQHLPHHPVTIEMLATAHEPHVLAIDRALTVASRHYRNPALEAGT
ncbi:MAG: sugar phosphate isomerase/epimerase family protein [Pseudomonadota bacterium]